MSHIPKKAQRAIDAANRASAARVAATTAKFAAKAAPKFMSLQQTPRAIMNMYDIYFDGERQQLCLLADVNNGLIHRYRFGKGNRGAPDSPIDVLQGKVEIKLRSLVL